MTRSRYQWDRATAGEVIPAVSVIDLGVAFTLFRRAAVDEEEEHKDLFRPLSDIHAQATMSQDGFHRGMALLKLHYRHPDKPTAEMRRIDAFVRLLHSQANSTDRDWVEFSGSHDSFIPVLHAIAWCPVSRTGLFDVLDFMRLARSAPLTLLASSTSPRPN